MLFLYGVDRRSPDFGGNGLWLPLCSRYEEEPLSFKFLDASGLGFRFKSLAAFSRAFALSMVTLRSSPKSLDVDSVFFRIF